MAEYAWWLDFSKKLAPTYQSTRRHIPEDSSLYNCREYVEFQDTFLILFVIVVVIVVVVGSSSSSSS